MSTQRIGHSAKARRPLEAPPELIARRRRGKVFQYLCLAATLVGVVTLIVLLADVLIDGVAWLSPTFFTEFPSRIPGRAGIKSALYGTIWLMGLCALISFPLGVAAAIWLEEYAKKGWLQSVIQTNIANLAGVPSIVYGILGLAVFVRWMVPLTGGRSVMMRPGLACGAALRFVERRDQRRSRGNCRFGSHRG